MILPNLLLCPSGAEYLCLAAKISNQPRAKFIWCWPFEGNLENTKSKFNIWKHKKKRKHELKIWKQELLIFYITLQWIVGNLLSQQRLQWLRQFRPRHLVTWDEEHDEWWWMALLYSISAMTLREPKEMSIIITALMAWWRNFETGCICLTFLHCMFLATLVALHLTPVSEWVSRS